MEFFKDINGEYVIRSGIRFKPSPDEFEKMIEEIKKLINSITGYNDEFVLDKYVFYENGDICYTLIQKYNGYLIYDNYISVSSIKEGISEIRFALNNITKMEKFGYSDILSPEQILISCFPIQGNTEITKMDIGFKKDNADVNDVKESQTGLCLRILQSDGIYHYISLVSGKQISGE